MLLIGIAYATESQGNVDIAKRDIIEDCEEVDELGLCITNEEVTSVTERIMKTTGKMGNSIAVNAGMDGDKAIISLIIFVGAIVVVIGLVIITVMGG